MFEKVIECVERQCREERILMLGGKKQNAC